MQESTNTGVISALANNPPAGALTASEIGLRTKNMGRGYTGKPGKLASKNRQAQGKIDA